MKLILQVRIPLSLLIVWVLLTLPAYGQITKIMGTITNASTGEPIPFVNIYFPGTTIGVTSDFEGQYAIETYTPGDSLTASYVGYISISFQITHGIFQRVDFTLDPDNILLEEVVVLPGENPAEVLLRKVIENKEKVFNKYFRENKTVGGYGLGLSIIKDIADKYHIDIELQSDTDKGTIFTYIFHCHTNDIV